MFAATDLLLTVSHHQFCLGLVMILLLGLISTTSMEWSILCLYHYYYFLFCSPCAKTWKKVKKLIKQTKNAPFDICIGNKLF